MSISARYRTHAVSPFRGPRRSLTPVRTGHRAFLYTPCFFIAKNTRRVPTARCECTWVSVDYTDTQVSNTFRTYNGKARKAHYAV